MYRAFLVVVATIFLSPSARAADGGSAAVETSAWSEGGLQKTTIKGLDVVYARPGASLSDYHKVLLQPIEISFHRDWEKREVPGSRRRISASDSQRIKDRLANLVREELRKELAGGGYELTDSAGDDVLEVHMAIVNLYVTAPNVAGSGNTDTFALTAGQMSLVAELRDSITGDVIARIFDHAAARESSWARRITSVDNAAEAAAITSSWAKILRQQLDLAKGIGASH
jgi:Protein of unknown function (DUF3313)